MPPPEKPGPRGPKLKPPRPKPGQELKKPMPVKPEPEPEPERDGTAGGGVPLLKPPQPFSCTTLRLCPPPPAPPATVHLSSGHLPTPLIALSASLLAVSVVLLLALLVRWLVRRRRQRDALTGPLAAQGDEESVLGEEDDVAMMAQAVGGEEEEEAEVDDDGGGVHHVWYIRTKGLDERAIAAIAAVVYDARKKPRAGMGGGCAVCLAAEFRDGETLRLLPRCGHAFHRACIDPWLRAHVNCPLCRAPVQVTAAASKGPTTGTAVASPDASTASLGGSTRRTEEDSAERRAPHLDRAVRRAQSMVTLPRRPWPGDVSIQVQAPPASHSGREEDMTGLAKIRRLLKLSEVLDMAGIVGSAGRSVSFGAGRSCQRLPPRYSGPSSAAAAGVNGEETQ